MKKHFQNIGNSTSTGYASSRPKTTVAHINLDVQYQPSQILHQTGHLAQIKPDDDHFLPPKSLIEGNSKGIRP